MTIPSITQPRYRYHEVPPESISVPVAELLKRLPAAYCRTNDPGERRVALPCRELLSGNTPRLPLGLLLDLLPDFMVLPEDGDRALRIPLPGGWLALHFHLLTKREQLPPEPENLKPAVEAECEKVEPAPKESLATSINSHKIEEKRQNQHPSPTSTELLKEQIPQPPATQLAINEVVAVPSQNTSLEPLSLLGNPQTKSGGLGGFLSSLPIFFRNSPDKVIAAPQEPKTDPSPESTNSSLLKGIDTAQKEDPLLTSKPLIVLEEAPLKQPLIVDVATTTVLEESPSLHEPVSRKQAPKNGFFASLPIFQRHTSSKVTLSPEKPQPSLQQPDQLIPVMIEPLWKLDAHSLIPDPSALQTLFMTEENLSLDRVIALAGQLPGLRACVLVHGSNVICASSTPTGFDLQTLSRQAMTMLSQIRESSENLGLGAVPAITLHAEQGALSFLHHGELCLLVMHTDRGFLPGVRERLLEMLSHLSSTKPFPESPLLANSPNAAEKPRL